jgi:hypothetical protein
VSSPGVPTRVRVVCVLRTRATLTGYFLVGFVESILLFAGWKASSWVDVGESHPSCFSY